MKWRTTACGALLVLLHNGILFRGRNWISAGSARRIDQTTMDGHPLAVRDRQETDGGKLDSKGRRVFMTCMFLGDKRSGLGAC